MKNEKYEKYISWVFVVSLTCGILLYVQGFGPTKERERSASSVPIGCVVDRPS